MEEPLRRSYMYLRDVILECNRGGLYHSCKRLYNTIRFRLFWWSDASINFPFRYVCTFSCKVQDTTNIQFQTPIFLGLSEATSRRPICRVYSELLEDWQVNLSQCTVLCCAQFNLGHGCFRDSSIFVCLVGLEPSSCTQTPFTTFFHTTNWSEVVALRCCEV